MTTPEKSPKHELLHPVAAAWVFDVDGPVTDPKEKRVTEPDLFDEKIKRLERGEPIMYNTGRSLDFLEEKVIAGLRNRLIELNKPLSLLKLVHAVGEKGGIELVFDEEGNFSERPDPRFSTPQQLQDEIRNLVAGSFSETMFYDETKRTMISVEMHDGLDPEGQFRTDQQHLVQRLGQTMTDEDQDQFKIDPTTIATDIEDKRVGKALGIQKCLAWLTEKGIKPELFVTFGDSQSDLPMHKEISKTHPAIFVFVGEQLANQDQIQNLKVPAEKYSRGTADFLKSPDLTLSP